MNDSESHKNSTHFARLGLFLLAIVLLTGCYFPESTNTNNNQAGNNPEDYATPSINIQFTLRLTQPVPNGEKIIMEILDEVSGLPNNAWAFELEQISELEYSLQKSFPAGSVVKYRYARLADTKISEIQSNGDPVRYRLCIVNNSFHVLDHLWGWQGENPEKPAGTLSGTILEQETHNPVPDILVSAGGRLTFTDSNGHFFINSLPSGVNNVVAYAINGGYQTFQQGAQISPGLNTPVNIELLTSPAVKVRFTVTPPGEAQGAPIYLAGNLTQLGNTFTERSGSMSLYPRKMPALTQNDDGTYGIELTLHAGTDLRYKFTLGDGIWNAERTHQGEMITRQLIIPNQDISLNQEIATWRSSSVSPITFEVKIPPEASLQDEKFIQFHTGIWTEPLPLWPTGGGNYLYILFSPLDEISSLGYRFCRNSNCQQALSAESAWGEVQIQPEIPPQTISVTIESWKNQDLLSEVETDNITIPLPAQPENYSTIIELPPTIDASWEVYAPLGLSTLAESGVSTVIFSPRWTFMPPNSQIQPILGSTPFHYQLTSLLHTAKTLNLKRGLFPQIIADGSQADWRTLYDFTEADKANWLESYRRFALNYANLAEISQSEWLILGGDAVLPILEDGAASDGLLLELPEESENYWQDLISDIRSRYNGQILWATHAHMAVDPLPAFANQLDGIYLLVDSPLSSTNTPTADEIAWAFTSLIDNHIYEVYRSTGKPVFLALGYPSVDGGAQGCLLFNQDCLSDGLFLPGEMEESPIDLAEQSLIYSAILPVVASRDWIVGTSIRGYEPTVIVQDASSSTAGKPAENIIRDWFLRINAP